MVLRDVDLPPDPAVRAQPPVGTHQLVPQSRTGFVV